MKPFESDKQRFSSGGKDTQKRFSAAKQLQTCTKIQRIMAFAWFDNAVLQISAITQRSPETGLVAG